MSNKKRNIIEYTVPVSVTITSAPIELCDENITFFKWFK